MIAKMQHSLIISATVGLSMVLIGCKDDCDATPTKDCITDAEIQTMLDAWAASLKQIGQAFTTGDPNTTFDPANDTNKQDCKAAAQHAEAVIKAAYAYDDGVAVLFKPTYAYGNPGTFRNTADGALSYFIGDKCFTEYKGKSSGYPQDGGFALGNTAGSPTDNYNETFMGFEMGSWAMTKTLSTPSDAKSSDLSRAWCDAPLVQSQFTVTPVRKSVENSLGDSMVDKSFGFIRNPKAGEDGALPLKLTLHHSSASGPFN